jgi:transposase-like protein
MDLPGFQIPRPVAHRIDADFHPRRCPREQCPSHTQVPFAFQCKGRFSRKVDARTVQRYKCLVCRKGFSSQTFRLDYRIKKPWLPLAIFQSLVSKCSIRQTGRNLACKPDTVLHHLGLLGNHARQMHTAFLARHKRDGPGLEGTFQLDELETFEIDRRLCPLTVPILIDKHTWFVVHAETGTLPARGNLREHDKKRKEAYETAAGTKRVSRSKEATTACFAVLRDHLGADVTIDVQTDEKKTYRLLLRQVFGKQVRHQWVNSKAVRNRANLLFPINNTLAQARDNLARLVRRSWCHSKRERNLRLHLWIWMLYRNYVREITNQDKTKSSASAAGIARRRLTARELLQWKEALPKAA